MPRPPVTEHGRSMWLHHGCRCRTCHADVLRYSRLRAAVRAVQSGREPAPRIDPGPARRHVEELRRAGWSVRRIADAAGVSHTTVDRLVNRRLPHVALPTARALLAVGP